MKEARLTPALVGHAEAVLKTVSSFSAPADALVSAYFRTHRELGHADRAFVAEVVFAALRHWRSLAARCPQAPTPRQRVLATLEVLRGVSQKALSPVLRESEADWFAAVKSASLSDQPPAVCCDLPDWLYEELVRQWPAETVAALSAALNQPAPLDLRVNSLKSTRPAALAAFAERGIAAQEAPYSPLAIRLAEKPALARDPLFLAGDVEVQDEGSQLLGFLVEPKRGEMVVDFCAGAGGKTLLLGALMKNTGRLYAFDVSDKRLANLKPRLARSGLSNVHPARIEHERDLKIKRLAGKADRVLVDAPCSGLGTLRRNPDLKWRQTPQAIEELCAKQRSILAAAARLVRPGGRLVYATCSLLQAENAAIAEEFLAGHPEFSLLSAGEILARQGIDLPGRYFQLLPQKQGTDGFFAAVFEKAK